MTAPPTTTAPTARPSADRFDGPLDGPLVEPAVTVPEWGRSDEAAPTAQLIRAGSEAAGRLRAAGLALPDLDELEEPVEDRDPLRGQAASWAAGHRDGFAAGHEEGLATGLEQGLGDGRQVALDALEAEIAAVRDGVATALAAEEDRHRRQVEDVEARVVDLALTIAEAVIGHHVRAGDDAVRHALERALALAPDRGTARVRLHPDDVELLGQGPVSAPAAGRDVELVADPGLRRGGCVVEVDECVVDATVDGALSRVREVLAP